jgi:uracil-DNA glycosylase family 4
MDESNRKHPLARCENCDLFTTGRYVPSAIPTTGGNGIAVVGEAPGANEARLGVPFSGVSGRILDKVLQYYHIERKDTLLSNACSCRPPENATPSATAMAACRPRLLHELGERDIQKVVALGNTAARTLLGGKDGITRLRVGPPKEIPNFPFQVIPTFHPAACLRPKGDSYFPSIVSDFAKLKGLTSAWVEPQYVALDTSGEALAGIRELATRIGPITVDIETDVDKDVSFEHPRRHTLLCVGIGYERRKVCVLGQRALQDGNVRTELGSYLRGRSQVVAQNGKFDLAGLHAKGMPDIKLWFDTMLASYCLDERPGIHGLKYQAVEKLGAPKYDDEIKRYLRPGKGYGTIPRSVLYKYNAYDCAATYELYLMLSALLDEEPGLRALHDFLCRASNELMYVELNGIGVDLEYNSQLSRDLLSHLGALEKDLAVLANRSDFNPRSPKQVVETLEAFGVRVPHKRNQAGEYRPTTDVDALNYLLERTEEGELQDFLNILLDHRKEAKSYGTYVKGLRKRVYRNRVFPTFLLHGTTTGRTSSRNPNLQNVTRGETLRKQFVPIATENTFVQADYKQAELRILTWLAQEPYFRTIFDNPDRDLFTELAPVLYGNVSVLDKAAAKELRIRIKAYVYGLSYGREAKSIAEEFKISVAEAARGMRAFFEVIPNIVEFRENTRQAVHRGEDLITPFGRHRRFWLITDQNKHEIMNEALAFLPQSTASDVCLRALIYARPALKGIGYIRNIVHDSLLAECPKEKVEETQQILTDCMLRSAHELVGDYVRFDVDVTTGDNWGVL